MSISEKEYNELNLDQKSYEKKHKSGLSIFYKIAIFLLLAGVLWLAYKLYKLETYVNDEVRSISQSINSIDSKLSYTTALAENADRYAHSHSYSDLRLKTDIQEISNPLDRILLLNGVTYKWKTSEFPNMGFDNSVQIGLIAQQVEQVFPELVTTDALGYKQVDYERLTVVLIEALKQQQAEINSLKSTGK